MVSKTRSSGVTRLKSAREHCDKVEDPDERRKCLDDVLFDTVESIGSAVQEMDARNADRTNLMEQRLVNIIEKGFNTIDARFNAIDARFNAIDTRFNAVDGRLNDIEKRVGLHDVDIAQIKSWVGTVFERVNAIEPKITMMSEKIDAMETTITRYFSKTGAGMHQ